MFTTVAVAQLLYAYAVHLGSGARGRLIARGEADRFNGLLLAGIAAGILLQIVIVSWAPARGIFGTVQLSLEGWLLAVAAAAAPALAIAGLPWFWEQSPSE